MELFLVVLVALYFLTMRALVFAIFFKKGPRISSYRPVVTYPTTRGEERPKELEEIFRKIQETTAGPPLVGEETDMGVY